MNISKEEIQKAFSEAISVFKPNLEIIRLLVDSGADINDESISPVFSALFGKKLDLVYFLINQDDFDFNVKVKTFDGGLAVELGLVDCVLKCSKVFKERKEKFLELALFLKQKGLKSEFFDVKDNKVVRK
jgi:hypothetical protein